MVFKINVSDKGKTFKLESDNEALIRMKIGDKLEGEMISADLDGYELQISGTSDVAGFPGIKGHVGPQLRRVLLTKNDKGMNQTRPQGLRLKKSIRGEEISEKTVQINTIVIKEGAKKFNEICPTKPAKEKNDDKSKKAPVAEAPAA